MVTEKLPKIWAGRIKKYWDKVMPANYPKSSSEFSLTFAGEEKEVVDAFEADVATEAAAAIDEGYFASEYIATYDVTGTPGEKTLLCPEAVTPGDLEEVKALHYNEETESWDNIEDIEVDENGYVWGTLESFSPIAIILVKRDIEVLVPSYFPSKKFIVANGNPISVYQDDNNTIFVKNLNSGKVLEATGITHIVGGTADGTSIGSTNVNVKGVVDSSNVLVIFAGSCWYSDAEEFVPVYVKEANATITDSVIRGVTGSAGAVRTEKANIVIKNTKLYYSASCMVTINGKDCNGHADTDLTDKQYLKYFNGIIDGSEIEWAYFGGNSGYTYTHDGVLKVTNSKITGGLTCAGSNGTTNVANVEVENSEIESLQSCNRGFANDITIKVKDCTIANMFALGDANDTSVNGIAKKVKLDTDKGTYNFAIGTQDGVAATADVVENVITSVKFSRSADLTISEQDKLLLGNKLIIK